MIRKFRRTLPTACAIAGAGTLVVGLVIAPPDTERSRPATTPVQLTAFVLTPATTTALPRTLAAVPVALDPAVLTAAAKALDATTILVDATLGAYPKPTMGAPALDSVSRSTSQDVNTAALTTDAVDIRGLILSIVGPIILFAPIIAIVILACPPCAVVNFVTSIIRSILADLTPLPAVAAVSAKYEETQILSESLEVEPITTTTTPEPAELPIPGGEGDGVTQTQSAAEETEVVDPQAPPTEVDQTTPEPTHEPAPPAETPIEVEPEPAPTVATPQEPVNEPELSEPAEDPEQETPEPEESKPEDTEPSDDDQPDDDPAPSES